MGIKRVAGLAWTTTTASWVVLQECGHERLQFYWFRSAVKLFNSMLNTNSNTLRRIVQADLNLQPRSVPAGQLNCWAHFRDCVDVSYMYELFKLGMLLPCKNLLQIWSIGWEVFGETLSWWTPTRTTTNWPPIILGLPSLFLEMSVCRLMYHGISILICPNMLCAI